MRNLWIGGLALAVGMWWVSTNAMAADDEGIGLYLTPKIGASFDQGKYRGAAAGELSVGTILNEKFDGKTDEVRKYKTTFAAGGALGFDLYPKLCVPVRAEVEYMHMGRTKHGFALSETIDDLPRGHTGQIDANFNSILNMQALMFNAYYDFRNSSIFTPYIGAGLGWGFLRMSGDIAAKASISGPNINESVSASTDFGRHRQTNLAWNIGVGTSVDLGKRVAFDIGYRFVGLGKAHTNNLSISETTQVNIPMLGNQDLSINSSARGEARNVYAHQILAGFRFKF